MKDSFSYILIHIQFRKDYTLESLETVLFLTFSLKLSKQIHILHLFTSGLINVALSNTLNISSSAFLPIEFIDF